MRRGSWPPFFLLALLILAFQLIPSLDALGPGRPALAAAQEPGQEPDPEAEQAKEYFRQGLSAARDKAYEDAIQFFQASLRLKPQIAFTHINLGYTYQKLGRLSEAEQAYRKAISLMPNSPQVHLNLGNVLKATGRLAEAERAFKEAIRLKPDFARAHNNLAWLWVSSKGPAFRHPREAMVHAKEAVRLTERMSSGPLDTLAETHYALGQCWDAVQIEEEAVDQASDIGPYKKSLRRFMLCLDAQRAARDGNLAKARQRWQKILYFNSEDWRARQELARLQ